MYRLMLFLINKYLLLLPWKHYFLLIFLLHFFTFLPVSSTLSVKWHVASLIRLHNSASGIMFRINKAKICTRLTTKNSETDSAFHIWFLNTSGKNHPAFLGKLLGNTCLTYSPTKYRQFSRWEFWTKAAFNIAEWFLCAAFPSPEAIL